MFTKILPVDVQFTLVDGGWSSWSPGLCSKTCGGGTLKRTRLCDNPKPSCGGKECKGPSSDNSVKCNEFCCPGRICNVHSIICYK